MKDLMLSVLRVLLQTYAKKILLESSRLAKYRVKGEKALKAIANLTSDEIDDLIIRFVQTKLESLDD